MLLSNKSGKNRQFFKRLITPAMHCSLIAILTVSLVACHDSNSLGSETGISHTSPIVTPKPITTYIDNVGDIKSDNQQTDITDDDTPSFLIDKNLISAKLYVDGQLVEADYDKDLGTLTPKQAIAVGKHEFSYVIVSQNANHSLTDSPKSKSFLLEMIATSGKPTPITSYKDDFGSVTGDYLTATSTDDSKPSLNVGKNLTDVKLYVDGNLTPATYDANLGLITPKEPVTAGIHSYSYTIFDKVTGESQKSDAFDLQYSNIADLDNKIEQLEKIANDPNVPFTTPEEFKKSTWGKITVE